MRFILKTPMIRVIKVVIIFSLFGCQTEKIQPQSTIVLVTEAIKYLKSNSLINESELNISGKSSELNKLKPYNEIGNLKFNLFSIEEAFIQGSKDLFYFRIIESSLMKFSYRDELGNYTRYLLKYDIESNAYIITKRDKLDYSKSK